MEQSKKVKRMVGISMLSAIGFLLMSLIEIPVPGFPPFLKIDISDVTALIALIIYGPGAAILVELLKNSLHFLVKGGTAGVPVGEFANFLAGVSLLLPTYYIWKRNQSLKFLTIGMLVGTFVMAIVLSLANYFFIYPLYEKLVGLSVPNLRTFVVTFVLPFNVLKGLLVTFVFGAVYVSLKSWFQIQIANKQI